MRRRGTGLRPAALGVLWTCAGLGASARAEPPPEPAPAAPSAPRKSAPGPVVGGNFARRHDEYVALAANGGERALAHLVAAYRRPLEPTERARIVSIVCDAFEGVDLTAPLRAWREKDADTSDAWLWYRTLRREIGIAGPDGAVAVARDAKRVPVLRAAAIHALAAWAEPGIPTLVNELAQGDLGKEPGRGVLLQALGSALASQPGRVGDPVAGAAFEALAPFLGPEGEGVRTRLALARAFARWLDTPRTTFDAAFYRALVEHRAAPAVTDDDRYAPPRFFGVEATGDRIVYVVDESGSMDQALTSDERDDLRAAAASARVGGGAHPATAEIPWDRIKTRREAAVEFTKASIRGLAPTASFAVLLFSDSFTWIGGKPELAPATPRNVEAALKALDRTRLGGGTNLHGGLRRAFDATVPGPARRSKAVGETVEPADLVRGPTTIFVLSDGAPTRDDWGFGERAGPPVGGFARLDPTSSAPYEESASIVDDVVRLNLYRGCEIHGVGIGEFSPDLFDRLARVGHGKVRRIGSALSGAGTTTLEATGPSGAGRTARDAVEAFRRLGIEVPDFMRRLAEAEAKEERENADRARKAPPPAAPGAGPAPAAAPAGPTPDEDRATLRTGRDAEVRAACVRRLAAQKHAPAIPDLVVAMFEDQDPGVRGLCEAALRSLTGRDFGWRPTLERFERIAVRRNWEWWWALHRAAIEREAAARAAAANARDGAKAPLPSTSPEGPDAPPR